MDLKEAINNALNGQAILFAGSGFSYGATNILGKTFRTGLLLRDYLASECGIKKTEGTLENAALLYKKKKTPERLIQILKNEFTLGEIKPYHESILSLPWKRIYTTNYDNVIEVAASKNGCSLTSITMSDNIEDHIKQKICVHINGSINNLNLSTLENEFKLVDRSYSCETLNGKPWFEFMQADFKSAKAIIIIGFSMQSDVDIKRIIAPPSISNKVIFITRPDLDEMDLELLNEYASCEQIGVQGFSQEVEKEKAIYRPSAMSDKNYNCFKHEYMETLSNENIVFEELFYLYFAGIFKDKFLNEPLPAPRSGVSGLMERRKRRGIYPE